MTDSTRSIGAKFEDMAANYLTDKGYKIIKRNFHFGKVGEIDIVAQFGKVLVFVEVKARTSVEYGSIYDTVPISKRKTIRRAAEGYLYVNKISDKECRLDFVGIDATVRPFVITHIENAF
jgi:putative endonuclease